MSSLVPVLTVLVALLFVGPPARWAAASASAAAAPPPPPALVLGAECPVNQQKLTMQQIAEGVKPYVLGGPAQPSCKNCEEHTFWRYFCTFTPGSRREVCSTEKQEQLLQHYLGQGTWGDYLTLTPCEMWPLIRGRTLFIVGDSQAHMFFDALTCFFFELLVEPHRAQDAPLLPPGSGDDGLVGGGGSGSGIVDGLGAEELVQEVTEPRGHVEAPRCVLLPEGTRLCYIRAIMLDFLETSILPVLPRLARDGDLVVMNAGVWHNNPETYERDMRHLEGFLSKYRGCLPYLLWMDSSMQHFNTAGGGFEQGWDEGEADPWRCAPLRGVTYDPATRELSSPDPDHITLHGGWRNKVARAAMRRVGIPVVETWNNTADLWAWHFMTKEHTDCTHFCAPSAQQQWVWELHTTLARLAPDIARHDREAAAAPRSETPLCRAMPDERWVPASKQVQADEGQHEFRRPHHLATPATAAAASAATITDGTDDEGGEAQHQQQHHLRHHHRHERLRRLSLLEYPPSLE